MAIEYKKGDILRGSFSLRTQSACDANQQDPYSIPDGAVVKVLFPGTSATVVIASDVAVASQFGGGFEVTIVDAEKGDCSFVLIPSKGANVKPSDPVDLSQAIDIVVYDSDGAQLQTFEITDGIICTVRANA